MVGREQSLVTMIAKPFARMLNGKISSVYAISMGVYAMS